MKILYLNHNLYGEGTFFRAFNFARELAKRGHDLTLITVSKKNKFKSEGKFIEGVRVIETPNFLTLDGGGWGPADIFSRLKIVKKEKFDIIHGFDHKPNVYFPLLIGRLIHKGTILFSDWADWWGKGGINSMGRIKPETIIEQFLEEDIRKRVDGVTVISRALERRAIDLKIPLEKIFYLPIVSPIDKIKPLSKVEIEAIKEKLNIEKNKKIMMFIGMGQIDLGILIEAFEIIKQRLTNAMFIIVGPLEKKYTIKVLNNKFNKDLVITGKVDYEKVILYASIADVYLMPLSNNPANTGRNPTKIGDYLAGGKPIIANPVGDIKDWIEKYECGLLANYDAEDMAECILKVFNDEKLVERLGKNARYVAENILSWEKVTDELEKIYKNFIKNN